MHIFQLGYPGPMGGANTEAWHTVRLWRMAGWDVTMIPTWGADSHWEERLASIGVRTVHAAVEDLERVPGLAGSIVVGMCNSHFYRTHTGGEKVPVKQWWNFPRLRGMGCKLVWCPCMTTLYGYETKAAQAWGPPDAWMFQSEFQRERFRIALEPYGYTPERAFLIRGAFFPDEFDFAPRRHAPGDPFVVGKLARPDTSKWSSNHWPIVARIPYQQRRALCMGWPVRRMEDGQLRPGRVEQKLGHPPSWADCLPPNEITADEFLRRCHCLLTINGGALENWPRVGLEAMASGVPVVAPNVGGWREMIEHDVSGYLCDTDADHSYWPAFLARNERRRIELATVARAHVEDISRPPPLIAAWERLFRFVEASPTPEPAPGLVQCQEPAIAGA